ncbi:MAG: glycoside hydrolase family 9 protein [Verrucomicrobia bacterium]|nr:glycoside hydrolase family 9 protein [Verrucomicrobiota bacterium]
MRFLLLASVGLLTVSVPAAPPGTWSARLAVDQFGYTNDTPKVAVIASPQTGFNAGQTYTPGATLEVRDAVTNAVVFSAAPTVWNGGATHAQSGDKVWWFDFSALQRWGRYYVYDPSTDRRSSQFSIHYAAYRDVLKTAGRVFFYQRRGFAKQPPFTDPNWADGASHLGANQDPAARLVTDQGNAATARDLRGGWFDAGDYNKYVNFTFSPLSNLLFAYQHNPVIWGDDWNIPESGNGLPDLLDEVKWELDWLLRMQQANGSVLSKVSSLGFNSASPPSADPSAIYYGAASTSATFCAAAHFAHAAKVFASVGQSAYAAQLQTAAVNAWNWGVANPAVTYTNAGFSSANPEVDAYTRDMFKLCAAIFLYAQTNDSTYKTYVESNYTSSHPLQWTYWYAFEAPLQDALLYYASLPGATTAVVNAIRASKQSSMGGAEFLPAWTGRTDAYRAYVKDADYVWGSNQVKASAGLIFASQNIYNLDPANRANYAAAAAGFVHYLHGVNPLTMPFLTNVYGLGVTTCANEMYHAWFGAGTVWSNALTSPNGPAPGYVTGGANPTFTPDGSYAGPPLVPPMNQPTQKSYRDWNVSFPENSWQITEPGIYYQAAYLTLLARHLRPPAYADWQTGQGLSGGTAATTANPSGDGTPNLLKYAFGLDPNQSNAALLPQPQLASHNVGGTPQTFLTLTFPRQLGAGNLTYAVEVSGDLGASWTVVCTATGTANASGPGFVSEVNRGDVRIVTARDTVAVTGAARRFLRVRVTMP